MKFEWGKAFCKEFMNENMSFFPDFEAPLNVEGKLLAVVTFDDFSIKMNFTDYKLSVYTFGDEEVVKKHPLLKRAIEVGSSLLEREKTINVFANQL